MSCPPVTARLDGRTLLVTGASGGIGLVTARRLAELGARVLLLCRDAGRGQAAVETIAAAAPAAPAPRLYLADLGRPEAVRTAIDALRTDHDALHGLVANAGFLAHPQRRLTPEGVEETMAVNHLGHYQLTAGLWPLLRAAGRADEPARVVVVSSAVHKLRSARFTAGDWAFAEGYSGLAAYARSKLANVLFTRELAARSREAPVVVNALHPGTVYTGVARTWPAWVRAVYRVGRFVMISAEAGARTSVWLAASPEGARSTGGYFVRCRPARAARFPGEDALRTALWDESAARLGLPPDWA